MCANKYFFAGILCFIGLMFSGCRMMNAPEGWLQDRDEFMKFGYGGWLTVYTVADSIRSYFATSDNDLSDYPFLIKEISGEFICIKDSSVFILTLGDSVIAIPFRYAAAASLELTNNKGGLVGGLAFIGTLSTISNGFIAILTAPMWIIGGVATSFNESNRDVYEEDFPKIKWWQNVSKFSRFPEGIPRGLDMKKLKGRKVI
jgi:hypothetical protein